MVGPGTGQGVQMEPSRRRKDEMERELKGRDPLEFLGYLAVKPTFTSIQSPT